MFLKKKRQKHLTQNGSFLQMTLPETGSNWPMHSSKPIRPEKNMLLRKNGDMGSFIKWYCKQLEVEDRKLNHLFGVDKVHLFNAISLWIRNIVIGQRVEDLQLGIESYQTKLDLTQPSWDATDFQFKEDYTIVHKPRAVIYKDRTNQKKMMRDTEVHKFRDGTLTRISFLNSRSYGNRLRVILV
ncbi:hypothetical protein Tco_1193008 [Tanacetum coccineum]